MKIVTNWHWREIQYDFDGCPYIDYKGFHLPLDVFDRWNDSYWHGAHFDSFFSAVVIRLSSDGEYCQVGTAYG